MHFVYHYIPPTFPSQGLAYSRLTIVNQTEVLNLRSGEEKLESDKCIIEEPIFFPDFFLGLYRGDNGQNTSKHCPKSHRGAHLVFMAFLPVSVTTGAPELALSILYPTGLTIIFITKTKTQGRAALGPQESLAWSGQAHCWCPPSLACGTLASAMKPTSYSSHSK